MVSILTISDEECKKILPGYVNPSNICAGVPAGGKGQCSVSKYALLKYNSEHTGIKTLQFFNFFLYCELGQIVQ
jgi:hypothetical protein